MSSLLNRKQVRQYALDRAKSTGRPFTRVSEEFYTHLEALLRTAIAMRVHRAPSRGITLKP